MDTNLESSPIALATSDTSAPVDSQISDMALMLEILCARKALAASFDNSDDQVFIVMIRSGNTRLIQALNMFIHVCSSLDI